MSDFSSSRTVISAKDKVCDQCMKTISKGTRHKYSAGVYDGDFYAVREHADCRELWLKLWDLRGLGYGDTQDTLINDDDLSEDKGWITSEYPEVAARIWSSEALPKPPVSAS